MSHSVPIFEAESGTGWIVGDYFGFDDVGWARVGHDGEGGVNFDIFDDAIGDREFDAVDNVAGKDSEVIHFTDNCDVIDADGFGQGGVGHDFHFKFKFAALNGARDGDVSCPVTDADVDQVGCVVLVVHAGQRNICIGEEDNAGNSIETADQSDRICKRQHTFLFILLKQNSPTCVEVGA